MKKKLLSLVLVFALLGTILAGCTTPGTTNPSTSPEPETSEETSTPDTTNEEPYTVKMILLGTQEPSDLAKIEEKVNEILLPAINMNLDISVLGFGAYGEQVPLMLSGGEKIDLVPVITNYAGVFVSQKQVVDLKPLIDEYGTNIKEYFGEEVGVANLDGYVYGIPTTGGWYTQSGFCMRVDWLEEAGFKAEDIKTIDDMEKVFEAVKKNHPDAAMYVPGTAFEDGRIETTDSLSDFNGVLADYGQDDKISNFYESDEYKAFVTRMYDWAQKGWISKDAATSTEIPSSLVKSETAFAYPTPHGPGASSQESTNVGTEMVSIPLYDSFITTAGTTYLSWSIAQNSENPEKAMQCLDYIFDSPEISNLLNWGIEGEHYVVNEDGTAGFVEGLDATTSGYYLNQGWTLPRMFISRVWEGNSPTLWEETAAFNDAAIKSKALGFRFDSTPVANQIAAISSVKGEYRAALNSGSVDPATVLPEYIVALETAGMSEVIDEKQAQYDTWTAVK